MSDELRRENLPLFLGLVMGGLLILGLSGALLYRQFRDVGTQLAANSNQKMSDVRSELIHQPAQNVDWNNAKIMKTVVSRDYPTGKITFVVDCDGKIEDSGLSCYGNARLRAKQGEGEYRVLGTVAAPSAKDYTVFRLTSDRRAQFNYLHDDYALLDFRSYREGEIWPVNDPFSWLLDTRTLEMRALKNFPDSSIESWNKTTGAYFSRVCDQGPECRGGDIWVYNPFTDASKLMVSDFMTRSQIESSRPFQYFSSIISDAIDTKDTKIGTDPALEEYEATLTEWEYKKVFICLDLGTGCLKARRDIKKILFSVPASFANTK